MESRPESQSRNRSDKRTTRLHDGIGTESSHDPLTPYPYLGQDIILPPKTIYQKDFARYNAPPEANKYDVATNTWTNELTNIHNDPTLFSVKNEFIFCPNSTHPVTLFTPFGTVINQELPDFPSGVGEIQQGTLSDTWFDTTQDIDHIFEFNPDSTYLQTNVSIRIHLNFLVSSLFSNDPVTFVASIFKGRNYKQAYAKGAIGSPAFMLSHSTLPQPHSGVSYYAQTITYDQTLTVPFAPLERLYLVFGFNPGSSFNKYATLFSNAYTWNVYDSSTTPPTLLYAHHATADASYIKLDILSEVGSSPAKVYMINEALSRAAEIITNDNIRVYSDYFGRTDALPYPSSQDGAGGLECITNGLLIRNYNYATAMQYGGSIDVRVEAATTYNLMSSDVNTKILFDTTTDGTVIIDPDPTNSTFPIGAQILIIQGNTGRITIIAGDPTVKITSPNGVYATTQPNIDQYGYEYTAILVTKVGTDDWLISSRAAMFTTLKDLIDGLNAIHAIGIGIEDDTATGREGKLRLRIEPIDFFYDAGTTVATFENVETVEIDVDKSKLITSFIVGYAKWEAEQSGGLDEFLTKREYRTTVHQSRLTLERLCKLVASGYAIEVTRRKFYAQGTTDWRYDNDTFIICLRRNGSTIEVELGGVDSAAHILDPTTLYNYRISPMRNALRWLRQVFTGLKDTGGQKLHFTSGTGNYHAYGLENNGNAVEAHPLGESSDLGLDDLASSSTPLLVAELVKFTYPLTYSQWVSINSNRYQLISYTINGTSALGFLQDLKYDLYKGMGEFILIPYRS